METDTGHTGQVEPLNRPDKPDLAFRIGIVGHRPNRLPTDKEDLKTLEHRLVTILQACVDTVVNFQKSTDSKTPFYTNTKPVFSAVTPLAEGADRLFAHAALAAGCRLCCPLPFAEEEYVTDFRSPESLAEFHTLLDQAKQKGSVFEIDGQRQTQDNAYGMAGSLVINQSEFLVAIWDGDRDRDRSGGTFQSILEALNYHVPVLWIDGKAPFGWQVLNSSAAFREATSQGIAAPKWTASESIETDTLALKQDVEAIVLTEISLPTDEPFGITDAGAEHDKKHLLSQAQKSANHLSDYLNERRGVINLHVLWKIMRGLVAGEGLKIPPIFLPPYLDQAREAWRLNTRTLTTQIDDISEQLVRHFAFADKQADFYADSHRSWVIYTSALAVFTVVLAILPFALQNLGLVANWYSEELQEGLTLVVGILELIALGVLLALLKEAKDRRWHDRWLEYRMLAEWLRQLRLLAPLGGGRPSLRTPPHLTGYGQPSQSWMYWLVRAVARNLRLPSARVNTTFKAQYLDELIREVSDPNSGQANFHDINYERSNRIDKRLREASEALLWFTLACVIVHIACLSFEQVSNLLEKAYNTAWARHISALILLATAGGPALAAALANINNQGEYARIAKRSLAMNIWLSQCASETRQLRETIVQDAEAVSLLRVSTLAQQVTDSMVQEVIDWHTIVHDQPHAPT
jgi:hypothetical protein